jgi:hypothetical protein
MPQNIEVKQIDPIPTTCVSRILAGEEDVPVLDLIKKSSIEFSNIFHRRSMIALGPRRLHYFTKWSSTYQGFLESTWQSGS